MDSVKIRELFIFNTKLKSPKKKPSDDEAQDAKLLYYYPEDTEILVKRSNIGIIEGTLGFMQSFEKIDSNYLLTELNKTYFVANGYEEDFIIGFILDKENSTNFNKFENFDTKKAWLKDLLDHFYNSFILFHNSLKNFFLSKETPEISVPLTNEKNNIVRDFVLNYFKCIDLLKLPIIDNLQYYPTSPNLQAGFLLAIQRLSEKLPELQMTSIVYKGKLIHNQLPFDVMSLFYNLFFSTYECTSKYTSFNHPKTDSLEVTEVKKDENKQENVEKTENSADNITSKETKKKNENSAESNKMGEEKKESEEKIENNEQNKINEANVDEKNENENKKEDVNVTSPYRKVLEIPQGKSDFLVGVKNISSNKYNIFIPSIYIKENDMEYKMLIYYHNGMVIFLFLDKDFDVKNKITQINKIPKWISKYFKDQINSLLETEKNPIVEYNTFCYCNTCNKSIKFAGFLNKKSNNSFDWKMYDVLQKAMFINEDTEMTSLTKFKGYYIYFINSIGKKVVIFYKDNISVSQIKQEIEKTKKNHFDYIFLN